MIYRHIYVSRVSDGDQWGTRIHQVLNAAVYSVLCYIAYYVFDVKLKFLKAMMSRVLTGGWKKNLGMKWAPHLHKSGQVDAGFAEPWRRIAVDSQ